MPAETEGPFKLPGVTLETWLLKFDERGECESPQTRKALLERINTDNDLQIILCSHGWNNEFDDTTRWYGVFLQHLQEHLSTTPERKPPLFVGVIWPSTWLSFDTGPVIGGTSEEPAGDAKLALLEGELAAHLAAAAQKERLHALLNVPALTSQEAKELADLLSTALNTRLSSAGVDGAEQDTPDSDSILASLKDLQTLSTRPPTDDEDEMEATMITPLPAEVQAAAGLLRYLDPRWALRIASVYTMKDRAGTVGATGVARLVKDILSLRDPSPQLHMMGHSYGAKVVLSAIAASGSSAKVESVLLLQPAISYLCFAENIPETRKTGGYFHVLSNVVQPVMTTFSALDFPLHDIFHRALRRALDVGEIRIGAATTVTAAGNPPNVYAALGGYGPRETGEFLTEPLPAPGTRPEIPAGTRVVGFDGTQGGIVSGHGDVATPHTAWLLFCQLTA
jgi:hypothetical protein